MTGSGGEVLVFTLHIKSATTQGAASLLPHSPGSQKLEPRSGSLPPTDVTRQRLLSEFIMSDLTEAWMAFIPGTSGGSARQVSQLCLAIHSTSSLPTACLAGTMALHALLEPWQHPGGHCLDLSLIFDHSSVFWKCPFWSWGHALSGPISPVSQVRRGRKLTAPHKRLCLAWPVLGTYSPTAPSNTDSSSCPITVSVGSFMTALHPRTMPSRFHAP